MRWVVFVIFAYIFLALETGASQIPALNSMGGVSPSFLLCFVVFLALFAPRVIALWMFWLLGLLVDISTGLFREGGGIVFIAGPHALGYVIGGLLLLQLRSLVFRERVLTIVLLTLLCGLVVSVVTVGIFVVRSWYPESLGTVYFETSATKALLQRFIAVLYSALLAIPVGWLLVRTLPLWDFQIARKRRSAW